MQCDQPPQTPASVPSPPKVLYLLEPNQQKPFISKLLLGGNFVLEILQVTDAQDAPENTLFRFVIRIYTPSDVTGSLKSDLGRWSKYLLVSVHAWTGPLPIYIQNLGSCNHFRVLPFSLQHEQELQPALALPSPALHSAAAAWCTDLLFNCAMWSLKDFFPPSFLLNSQDEIGFWSATLFSSSLPWGRVAKKDFCFVPFCLQSSGQPNMTTNYLHCFYKGKYIYFPSTWKHRLLGARELMPCADSCPTLTLIGGSRARQRMFVLNWGIMKIVHKAKWKAIYKNDIYFSF